MVTLNNLSALQLQSLCTPNFCTIRTLQNNSTTNHLCRQWNISSKQCLSFYVYAISHSDIFQINHSTSLMIASNSALGEVCKLGAQAMKSLEESPVLCCNTPSLIITTTRNDNFRNNDDSTLHIRSGQSNLMMNYWI